MNDIYISIVGPTCPICNQDPNPVRVTDTDYKRWKGGTNIQNAFPYLNADERESLKTGICPDCWCRDCWEDD